MQEVARTISVMLPPDTGFILLAFDRGDHKPGVEYRMEYVSNGQRRDCIKAMEEFIAKTKSGWGEHVP